MTALPLGQSEIRRRGHGVAMLAFGSPLQQALEAADRLDATVVNMRFVKPLDTDLIKELAANHSLLVTLEDNVVAGGAGSGVNEYLAAEGLTCRTLNLGLPDRFLEHGTREELLQEAGLDTESIYRVVLQAMQQLGLSAEVDKLQPAERVRP
jgi:1-deoxy-D-xylulose-5-phosphate synthase